MRGVLSGFAFAVVLAGTIVPSFADQASLTNAMSSIAKCKTAVACQSAWSDFQLQLATVSFSTAQKDKLQASALAKVTQNLGTGSSELTAFLQTPSVGAFVTSPGFQTASGPGTAACNFTEASAGGFCA